MVKEPDRPRVVYKTEWWKVLAAFIVGCVLMVPGMFAFMGLTHRGVFAPDPTPAPQVLVTREVAVPVTVLVPQTVPPVIVTQAPKVVTQAAQVITQAPQVVTQIVTQAPIVITATPAPTNAATGTPDATVAASSQPTPTTGLLHQCGDTVTTPRAQLKITCKISGGAAILQLTYTNLETGLQPTDFNYQNITAAGDDQQPLSIGGPSPLHRILQPQEAYEATVDIGMPRNDTNIVVTLNWGVINNVRLGFIWAGGKILPHQ